ncbi:prepilin-type N-terminal cleavage/methylation domain-containing protein, partial [Patescibacteria group bacterium]|nr:prepilin-type N-terminal cleavage/methylation domain-containing protein [Patescibacteria group bacterium]
MFLFSKYQKTLKKYTRYNNGFTVIEMLISAGIIAFLTTIFLVNYHGV